MRNETILRYTVAEFGALVTKGRFRLADGDNHFLVGTSPALEIKHIIFSFFHVQPAGTRPDLQLKWKLRHPPSLTDVEAILASGTIGRIDDFTPVIVSEPVGVVGYHRVLDLVFEEPMSNNALLMTHFLFELHFLDTAGVNEDKGVHEIEPMSPGFAARGLE